MLGWNYWKLTSMSLNVILYSVDYQTLPNSKWKCLNMQLWIWSCYVSYCGFVAKKMAWISFRAIIQTIRWQVKHKAPVWMKLRGAFQTQHGFHSNFNQTSFKSKYILVFYKSVKFFRFWFCYTFVLYFWSLTKCYLRKSFWCCFFVNFLLNN